MTRETGEISDGYHTFDELYLHRHVLFCSLMVSNPGLSWRAEKHSDGTFFKGYFIAGMDLGGKQITYHLPGSFWNMLNGKGLTTYDYAPDFDGHTSDDVIERLTDYFIRGKK